MSAVLHLPFNNDSMIPGGILDVSPVRNAVARYGDAALSGGQYKYGQSSCLLDGNGDYLTVSTASGAFVLGTKDFTVQLWVRFLSVSGSSGVFAFGELGLVPLLIYFSGGVIRGYLASTTAWDVASAIVIKTAAEAGVWYHIAVCRKGTAIRFFCDGVLVATVTSSASLAAPASVLCAGKWGAANEYFNGYLDDLFIDNGNALYTENFTPPEAIAYDNTVPLGCVTGGVLRKYEYMPSVMNTSARVGGVFGRDIHNGGNGTIIGTVKEKHSPTNRPLARRVRLHRSRGGMPIAETWSTPAGDYAFQYIDPTENYYTVGFDHAGTYRGVIADNLTPELM